MRRPRGPKARRRQSRVVFRGRVFRVRRDLVDEPRPGERGLRLTAVREVVEHRGSVVVLPVLADGRILLVRQYRHAVGEFLWELVAGRIEPGEAPRAAAGRELQEETGYRARRLHRLLEFFPTPGFVSEKMILYRATGLRPGRARPEVDEAFEVRAFSPAELEGMVRRGRLRDGKTLTGILWERLRQPRRRRKGA